MVLNQSEMLTFFFDNPLHGEVKRRFNNSKLQYFYFSSDLHIKTNNQEILNACLLSGDTQIIFQGTYYNFSRFDFFFLPPNREITIEVNTRSTSNPRICLFYYSIKENINIDFEIEHFDLEKFTPRGEKSSENKMATFRTVWTAIKNGYFMSGFTNIPNESLKQGVITSVNLERNQDGSTEIYSHIHPNYPEVYIMCIDDNNYAITQYLINEKGKSVCKDLNNGDGLFFSGNLGHSNFARPYYKNLKYCMYMWIIPTFHKTDTINPITLKI